MASFSGGFQTPKGRFGLIAARFNSFIVEHLVAGAQDGLRRHGVADANVDTIHVPGSLEIALVAKRLAESGEYAAVICLGAIVRGETDHYDVVVRESAKGLTQVALETGIPVINAVLTTHTVEQAVNRAGAKAGNKGFEAAVAAIEMVNLLEALPGSNS
ncbi:6,7-dimethyl-8-ribityllumazine synthase [Planctomycetes bacterium Pan216]|uniref:6,7-dimethyl-8-ribityllumazine synthase n=1 Tax=Kolteria novifilia TaxID=2527975 RepID=A0A518B1I9_9BACT|nr:6,7-dimethyl-8-ribityllumazine synthase [Planctomycetes bacterium Pan216]